MKLFYKDKPKYLREMRSLLLIIIVLIPVFTFGQINNPLDTTVLNPDYNPELSDKLGADEYGMKNYFLVILKTGPNTTNDKVLISKCFRGHFENINKLAAKKKLIIAGPFGKNDNNFRGIFIFNNIKNEEEVKVLLQSDPAIKNQLLDYDIFIWYGSAALTEYLPFSEKIWKIKP